MSRAVLAAVLLLAAPSRGEEVRVYAAASLMDALTEIAAQSDERVIFNFAASSTLARQIAEGAPCDVFVSADEIKVQSLSTFPLLTNKLAVVVARDADFTDLPSVRSLAIAEPSLVPAGIYAREYLAANGLWETLAPKIIPTDNVRAAMYAVESGNADAAIVYVTDTRVSKRVRVAHLIDDGPEIVYPVAVLTQRGQRFAELLRSEKAQRVFQAHGFGIAGEGAGATLSAPRSHPHLSSFIFHPSSIFWLTIRVAALAALLILPPGLAVAWLLARYRWRGKSLVETIVALPLVMPPVATGLILLRLFGRNGPFGALDVVFTWRAVVLAMMVMSFPLLVRAARVAFEEVNPRLEGVARTLGASSARVFATITLPLAARGIIGGLLLAFARALGEFGATILVAGNIPGRTTTLSLAIYNSVQLGRDDEAFRLLLYSVIAAFAAVWLAEIALRRSGAKP